VQDLLGGGSAGWRHGGQVVLLDWLEGQDGDSWQQRWLASGAEQAGTSWWQLPARWPGSRDIPGARRAGGLGAALTAVIAADVVRPSLAWLAAGGCRHADLARAMAAGRDSQGLARLRTACDSDPSVAASAAARNHAVQRAAVVMAAKGGVLTDITLGDFLELLDAEAGVHGAPADSAACYRALRATGIFGPAAPDRLRQLRTAGQRTPEELIDRHQLACRPIRDLLVDYLRERQPAIDYGSLEQLARRLGMFWADLERHHPGIDSLHLPADVADGWKQRLRTKPRTITTADGSKTVIDVERICYREFLTPVRAFYLDLAQWAIDDPARWGPWVAPCPVGPAETIQGKVQRHRKSRMDARTRERLPVLPVLARSTAQHRRDAEALLHAARQASPGATIIAGQTLTHSAATSAASIWADDPRTGKRRNLTAEEGEVFWAWAIVEVLRTTGIRVEELTQLSHHSLVQYRLPSTGELVPLLQIAPSKTDTERLLAVSPELADVLSAIITRVRAGRQAVPLVAVYDDHERTWLPPAPVLFQRKIGAENRALPPHTIRQILSRALIRTSLTDPADGTPLHCTPHDFRRIFLTDAIMNGLPPHIAQIIAGHRDINVTLGYKAVYPDEAIQAHLAFLARRRALRPTEEYRTPTDDEWAEFLGHFERRKVATGTCGRAFGTPCIHEHACIRCPVHWPDPAQRHRLAEIRDNLTARIAEAEREGWAGEAEGLKISLTGAEDKLAQIDRHAKTASTTDLGTPVFLPATAPPRTPVSA
jgi:integrase